MSYLEKLTKLNQHYRNQENEIKQQERLEDEQFLHLMEEDENIEIKNFLDKEDTFLSDENGEGCSICLLPFCNVERTNNRFLNYRVLDSQNTPIRINTCGHMFHYNCLHNACRTIGNSVRNCYCPICRNPFDFLTQTERLRACDDIVKNLNEIIIEIHRKYNEGKIARDKLRKTQFRERYEKFLDDNSKLRSENAASDIVARKKTVSAASYSGMNKGAVPSTDTSSSEEALLKASICLGKWESKISGMHGYRSYPRPTEFYIDGIKAYSTHPLHKFSTPFLTQIKQQPYAYENCLRLEPFLRLLGPSMQLKAIYRKTLLLRDAILPFAENNRIMLDAFKIHGQKRREGQDAYLNMLSYACSGIFSEGELGSDAISYPQSWGFRSYGEQNWSGQDMVYGNWSDNIAEIMLEKIDCYLNFYRELEPEVETAGGKMLYKHHLNFKKSKYKKNKTNNKNKKINKNNTTKCKKNKNNTTKCKKKTKISSN